MKRKIKFYKATSIISTGVALLLAAILMATGVFAETTPMIADPSPAIYVAQKTASSLVSVLNLVETWNPYTREASTMPQGIGSGVVIAEGGYVLTNNHVVSGGDGFQVILPDGQKVDAVLIGTDRSTDLAVVKVDDAYADMLVPADIGSANDLLVGSTVIAIGTPGGEMLANTVTSGIVSSLARDVDGGNTSRSVSYIQHDAAINSGNSGGGLFNVNGQLVGINTLKFAGSGYSASYEGLGFAIPVDTAYPIAMQIIENGSVARPGLGVSVAEISGAEEPTDDSVPYGLQVMQVNEGGPAERAGIQVNDIITHINGTRIATTVDLTDVMDQFSVGDTVEITVARYVEEGANFFDGFTRTSYTTQAGSYYSYEDFLRDFMGGFGGFGFDDGYGSHGDGYSDGYGNGYGSYGDDYSTAPSYTVQIITLQVTLDLIQ